MIKDTFFSWSRFQLLLKKTIRENWKILGLRLLLMYGVLALGMIWNGYFTYNSPADSVAFNSIFFFWMLCIFGVIGASFIMEELKTKTNKISFLMTPSTQFEKFFMKWSIYVVLFFISFLIIFSIADISKVTLYTILYPEAHSIEIFSYRHLVNLNNPEGYYSMIQTWKELGLAISGFLFGQSLFVLGGTIWPKNAFIKTFAAIIIILILSSFVIYYSFKTFFNPDSFVMTENLFENAFLIITSVLTIFNWTIAYFRFKETEIINRM